GLARPGGEGLEAPGFSVQVSPPVSGRYVTEELQVLGLHLGDLGEDPGKPGCDGRLTPAPVALDRSFLPEYGLAQEPLPLVRHRGVPPGRTVLPWQAMLHPRIGLRSRVPC